MSEERLLQDYLNDILESISDIREFVMGMSFDAFISDRKTVKAVIRSLEVIGEAVNKLPQEIRDRYPETPWQEMIGMRNRLIHEYFGVDLNIVWQTIEEDLGHLEVNVRKVYSDLYKGQGSS